MTVQDLKRLLDNQMLSPETPVKIVDGEGDSVEIRDVTVNTLAPIRCLKIVISEDICWNCLADTSAALKLAVQNIKDNLPTMDLVDKDVLSDSLDSILEDFT